MTPGAAVTLALTAGDGGVFGSRMLGFDWVEGVWFVGVGAFLGKNEPTVALGSQFTAVTSQTHVGFLRQDGRRCAAATGSAGSALIASLGRDPAWHKVLLLPLANPTTGIFEYTFIACTPEREDLIWQLIKAARRQARSGARAVPVVRLGRESHRADSGFDPSLIGGPLACGPPQRGRSPVGGLPAGAGGDLRPGTANRWLGKRRRPRGGCAMATVASLGAIAGAAADTAHRPPHLKTGKA